MFSHTAIQNNILYTGNLHTAYANILNNGEKVFVMNETRAYDILTNGVKLLVLPGTTHLSTKTIEIIKKFIEHGGTVVMMENDLLYDEHEYPIDQEIVDYIYENAIVMKREENESIEQLIVRMVKTGIEKTNLAEVKILSSETSETVTGVEFEYTEYEGKMILNIVNIEKTFLSI